jgi:LmbE family N-acetylglucosaminyl deacetylase
MISGTIEHAAGFLADAAAVPLVPPETVCSWGKTVVVAPHPDDESLGCGGAIALLSRFGLPVSVLFISDGTGSHPNSQQYPPPRLRDLRESEAREALTRLGAEASALVFLRLPDGAVPGNAAPGFSEAVTRCRAYLADCKPQTILLPWRRDPHPDRRAVSQILQAALGAISEKPRLLEYPVWAWERAAPEDVPQPHEVSAFRLDIRDAAAVKRLAVAAHKSQVTHIIDDDPHGFWLSPEVLAHFERPWEVYLEVLSW